MIEIKTVGSLTASFSRRRYQREVVTYSRPSLGVDWNSSSGRTCSRFRLRRLWGRQDRRRARVSAVKTRNLKRTLKVEGSTGRWMGMSLCVRVWLRVGGYIWVSEAEREWKPTKVNKDGKPLWFVHRVWTGMGYLDGWDNKMNANDTPTHLSFWLKE